MSNKFVTGFITTFILILFLTVVFNNIIDPFSVKEDKLYNNKGIPKERFFSAKSVEEIYTMLYKGDNIPVSIIGSSHVLYGIPDCSNPNLQRFALQAITFEEELYILQQLLKTSSQTKTIFIEYAPTESAFLNENSKSKTYNLLQNYFNHFLSLKATKNSLLTLFKKKSVKNEKSAKTICEQIKNDLIKSKLIFEKRVKKQLTNIQNKKKNDIIRPISVLELELIQSKLISISKGIKEPHKIIFFTSPVYEKIFDLEYNSKTYNENILKLKKMTQNINKKSKSMKFNFIDGNQFIKNKHQSSNFFDDWYDLVHFKPELGKEFLKYMQNLTKEKTIYSDPL